MDGYSLGLTLREAREAKEIEIDHAVLQLRVRRQVLVAFESGEFDIEGVPEVQVRGMLRIYARFLALDEEHILALYDQVRIAQQKGRRRRLRRHTEPAQELRPGTQPLQELQDAEQRASGFQRVLRTVVILLLSLASVAVIVFVTLQLVDVEGAQSAQAIESPTPFPATATRLPSPTPIPPSPTPSNRAQYSGSGVLVSLLVTQRSWLQISVDGVEQFNGIATPDTLLEFTALGDITLSAGNALALDVIWNGQQQPPVGARGQRANIRYTANEVIVELGPSADPTAQPTPQIAIVAPTTAPVESLEVESAPTQNLAIRPKASPRPTNTTPPLPVNAPTETPQPIDTPTITPTPPPTAILPPRVTQAGLPPPKTSA